MNLLLLVLFLAFVQGATEFLPVSSSGHLVLFQQLFHFDSPNLIFDIILHLGTFFSVVFFFRKKLAGLISHPFRQNERRTILMIIVATIPTALIGFFFKDFFESLFQSPRSVALGLLVTAAVLFLSRKARLPVKSPYIAALIVGVCQGIAIVPGISRSGMTIAAALILGLGFAEAFEFSFLLSLPAILGAVVLELPSLDFHAAPLPPLFAALAAAFLFGWLALHLLRRIGLRENFHLFAWYCLPAAVLAFIIV